LPSPASSQLHSGGENPSWNCWMLWSVMPPLARYSRARWPGTGSCNRQRWNCSSAHCAAGTGCVCRRGCPARCGSRCRRRHDPRLVRQQLQRLPKPDPFALHHKAEHVAADVADPALPALPLGIDLQTGTRVVMPGAKGHVSAALAAQLQDCRQSVRRCPSPGGPGPSRLGRDALRRTP
jgi:hypothetical protein